MNLSYQRTENIPYLITFLLCQQALVLLKQFEFHY